MIGLCLFFYRYGAHRDLHSFPTRRSSDLGDARPPGFVRAYHARNIRDEDEIVSFGLFEMTEAQYREWRAERSEEHTSELQSRVDLVCRLLLEKKKDKLIY